MRHREEKIRQIVQFVKNHPDSLASRTVVRRFMGTDYEMNEELVSGLEGVLNNADVDPEEIDSCYDLIK